MRFWLEKARGNPGGVWIGIVDIAMVAAVVFFMLIWGLGKLQQWPTFQDPKVIFVIIVIWVFSDLLRMIRLVPSNKVAFLMERFNNNTQMVNLWFYTSVLMAILGLVYLFLNWTVLGLVTAAVCGFPQRLYIQLCLREPAKFENYKKDNDNGEGEAEKC